MFDALMIDSGSKTFLVHFKIILILEILEVVFGWKIPSHELSTLQLLPELSITWHVALGSKDPFLSDGDLFFLPFP